MSSIKPNKTILGQIPIIEPTRNRIALLRQNADLETARNITLQRQNATAEPIRLLRRQNAIDC